MHINEQTPGLLKEKLDNLFENCIIWVASDDNVVGSITGDYTDEMMHASRCIFAVASHRKLSKEVILSQLTQNSLNRENISIEITIPFEMEEMRVGEEYILPAFLRTNRIRKGFLTQSFRY
ncbi:hypothetical protein [Methanolacinia petrolearia]|uniref:hypothetical protein n=1 Tax=Methanolacinia petrolearia TaxID=54120 RepID=UPI003BAD986A